MNKKIPVFLFCLLSFATSTLADETQPTQEIQKLLKTQTTTPSSRYQTLTQKYRDYLTIKYEGGEPLSWGTIIATFESLSFLVILIFLVYYDKLNGLHANLVNDKPIIMGVLVFFCLLLIAFIYNEWSKIDQRTKSGVFNIEKRNRIWKASQYNISR